MVEAIGYLTGGVIFAAFAALMNMRPIESDTEAPTYGYDRSRVWCFIALGFGALLAVVWLTSGLGLDSGEGIAAYALGWFVLAGTMGAYVYCLVYRITATQDALLVRGLVMTRSIPYRDIQEVVLKDGAGRSGALLELFDRRGKRVLTATSSFDYLGLSGVVRTRAARFGVQYRHRDSWGKWS